MLIWGPFVLLQKEALRFKGHHCQHAVFQAPFPGCSWPGTAHLYMPDLAEGTKLEVQRDFSPTPSLFLKIALSIQRDSIENTGGIKI